MLVLKGNTYHYRRRVPKFLKSALGRSEVWQSLGTASTRSAASRAAALDVLTERVFREASRMIGETDGPVSKDIYFLVSYLKKAGELIAAGRDGTSVILELEEEMARLESRVADDRTAIERSRRRLDEARAVASATGTTGAALLGLGARAEAAMAKLAPGPAGMAENIEKLQRDVAAIAGSLTLPTAAEPPPAPLFTEHQAEFFKEMGSPSRDGDTDVPPRWGKKGCGENKSIFRLFVELEGDRPVNRYALRDAVEYEERLRALPKDYGRSPDRKPPAEAIAEAQEARARGIVVDGHTRRAVERHFSALSPYWKWLRKNGHVTENIFGGYEFSGTKSGRRSKTKVLMPEELEAIFHYRRWYGDGADRTSAWFWFPLIAGHSGMRPEEIAQLRPSDIRLEKGVWIFDLREHGELWSPKTEAGIRIVPIHHVPLDLGFLDFAELRRTTRAERIFTELKEDQYGHFSPSYLRKFSKVKISLGMGQGTVFYSFRHTVRTLIGNVNLDDDWIDAVMGHAADDSTVEGAEHRPDVAALLEAVNRRHGIQPRWKDRALGQERSGGSEGDRTYDKGLSVITAQLVIESIALPVDLSHLYRSKR